AISTIFGDTTSGCPSQYFNSLFRQSSCCSRCRSNSFPKGGNSYNLRQISAHLVSYTKHWPRGCFTNPRRSGAQRGARENKLRPEVFSSVPCFLCTEFGPLPTLPANLRHISGENQLFPDIHSGPSQKCGDRGFVQARSIKLHPHNSVI